MKTTIGKTTFKKLLSNAAISIPMLQRDYAQGRDTRRVELIREGFIKSIWTALDEKKQLNLDFVYGSLRERTFYPIDGQQRLTTLFLLHFYLGLRHDKDNLSWLGAFSYETRASSRRFCSLLIKDVANLRSDGGICELIKDRPWFRRAWLNDPTVSGMLVMLRCIELAFKKEHAFKDSPSEYWTRLVDEDIISFDFLDLATFNGDDTLYIRMNARGRALTDFENFKAKLLQHAQKDSPTLAGKLDAAWLDYFWTKRGEERGPRLSELSQPILPSRAYCAAKSASGSSSVFCSQRSA